MTETFTRLEHDCTTGITKQVELTAEEIAELQKLRSEAEEKNKTLQAESNAKAQIKASALAKLAKLGLTEEEAKAIAG